jgi:aspartyl-tRNA(Asn)/glutamyl-tRNA(Gln) amidotransferase subunit C
MKITKADVEYIAHLARLEIDAKEIELYTMQVDRILEYVDKLNSLDTKGIEPTSHPMPVVCVLRKDGVRESFSQEEATRNAPEKRKGFFKVPPIIETEE